MGDLVTFCDGGGNVGDRGGDEAGLCEEHDIGREGSHEVPYLGGMFAKRARVEENAC